MAKPRKGRKKRDYKAEYARRMERAERLHIPRSVARGHARTGVAGIKLAKILGITPGAPVESRPRQPRHEPGDTRPTFEERLEKAGFGSWIYEQRRRVLLRDTDVTGKEAKQLVTRQEDFVQVVMESGHSEKEAYTQWFSPK